MDKTAKVDLHKLEFGEHTIELKKGEWVKDPSTTSGRIVAGPATLRVVKHADGGLDVHVNHHK